MKKITSTVSAKDIKQQWWLLDADNQVLGRFASQVAQILRGKHRPNYAPNLYMGDAVIIVNADKIRLTGNKADSKKYFSHSGYPGGVKFTSYKDLMKNDSDKVLLKAIKGMLPKNRLGNEILTHLRIYKDSNHGQEAQQPTEWSSI
ncbi:50S ribosomal protein L13 [Candidatus Marinimicrobia bacterium]|jgi:large subunit ribosomal protein L13|nr:50S ribosomal protein L13 [Candidatus Neomarinimicrobiota bacterium]MDA7685739.1 50S ribosomal protein L13 [Candidatus Neomarinimicrobiota bacterium]MDA9841546.1 50S ribosomal protein L13 [Candidatus Neomarinimicrobiota bacterium]MDB3887751.1 50S ribosomal protein L13 [Candidatus Neomarinimicrobiota bacterium]MDC0521330.1 50S ribosomal protein L13 [Candidatus Neomarinimicrobiota bacterium]|tara:strand:+ start:5269 stop:5706 length:438 start_codon:yes stop_codon:yes gene_type:complete